MADVRAYLRARVRSSQSLAEILAQARHLLIEDLGDDHFITLLFGRLAPAPGHWQFINAGHSPGYVLAAAGRIKAQMRPGTPAPGIDREEDRLETGKISLEKGDLVLLLTDGILEAHSAAGEEFGEERALEIVRRERDEPAAEIIRVLMDEVRRFGEFAPLEDDVAIVVIKR